MGFNVAFLVETRGLSKSEACRYLPRFFTSFDESDSFDLHGDTWSDDMDDDCDDYDADGHGYRNF